MRLTRGSTQVSISKQYTYGSGAVTQQTALDTLVPQCSSKAVNHFPKLGRSQLILPSLKAVKMIHVLIIAINIYSEKIKTHSSLKKGRVCLTRGSTQVSISKQYAYGSGAVTQQTALDTLVPQCSSKAVNYFPKLGRLQLILPSLKAVKITHVLVKAFTM
ncbi:hypothetical protein A4244_13755 [Bacillus badius]|nr:hypothetical protein A4244_13755 [Bacillus badius]KZR59530.1 hypothetical protein A3781_12210 [Bacillus badius]OCS89140.1 hypothetical protein A6M11_13775 [Bacillus badius]OVE50904.1 hypothetical protein B1A98_14910 [Bacillus badius]TDW01621.1 hypothetical protein B0G66_11067 [Bacillus badius]